MRRDGLKKVRAGDQLSIAPVLVSAGLQTMLSHKRAIGPLVAPAETVHPLRVCTVSAGQITALITPVAIRPLSVPFPSGGFAARSSMGGVWERIGREWVIYRFLLDFSLLNYIYILLRWIFRRRFFRCRIIRRRKCQQRQKGQGTSICALPFIVHIVPRRVLSSRPQK